MPASLPLMVSRVRSATMRTFHTGGVAEAISHRVSQELRSCSKLESLRAPAEICEGDGEVVSIEPTDDNRD